MEILMFKSFHEHQLDFIYLNHPYTDIPEGYKAILII